MKIALSKEEKARNKARFSVRDRLHRELASAYYAAIDREVSSLPENLKDNCDEANAELERLRTERNSLVEDFQRQIAQLEERINVTKADYQIRIDAVAVERRRANTAYQQARDAAEERGKALFPDLSSTTGTLYSAAAWGQSDYGKRAVEEATRAEVSPTAQS